MESALFLLAQLFGNLSFPILQIRSVEGQVDGLAVVVVEAEADAVGLADGRQAGPRQFYEQFVFVLIGMVFARTSRFLFDGGLHFPGVAVGVEDGLRFEF